MNAAEMKKELINRITKIDNETILEEVLSLLKKTDGIDENSFNLSRNYEAIRQQYGDVLQKLAQ